MPACLVRRAWAECSPLRLGPLFLGVAAAVSGASIQVLNTTDAGPGSLRHTILDANAAPGADTITFQIPGSGVRVISPSSPLPPLLEPVVLDATTQPGYSGQPVIELSGVNAGNNSGLRVLAGGCVIRGLAINRFAGCGIMIEGGGTNTVEACCLGTDPAGSIARPNGFEGIWVYNSAGNFVGGRTPSSVNIISGNHGSGVYIQNGAGNIVQGNLIGTTASGTAVLGNRNNGVVLYNAPASLVGGSRVGDGNLISANGASGIYLLGPGSVSNTIHGNRIGTGIAGGSALSNAADGITINGACGNLIGGTRAGEGNLVSGNGRAGIALDAGANHNSIQGNVIGASADGTAALGNSYAGIWLSGATNNAIGGSVLSAGNLISGNRQDGILLSAHSTGNVILGNRIGVHASGFAVLPNLFNGIAIAAAHSNTIGGLELGARNLISGNAGHGIHLAAGASANTISENFIGPDTSGTRPLPNGHSGIRIESPHNRVDRRNIISGNGLDGLTLSGSSASNNLVEGNLLGTRADGLTALPNNRAGIGISAAPRNVIGGASPDSGNLISANADAGIYLVGPGAVENRILGNRIGTDCSGTLALGNAFEGIYLEDAHRNSVGFPMPDAANLISGNHTRGIFLTNSSGNLIQGNSIGADMAGSIPLPNGYHNIEIAAGCDSNRIAGNRISFAPAPYAAVRIRNGSIRNRIDANSIFANGALGIDLGTAGPDANDPCDSDSGANSLQNNPVLSRVFSGLATTIEGTLNSSRGGPYEIQFFANFSCDLAGFGEGQIYLGRTPVVCDTGCGGEFRADLPVRVPHGWYVTATATAVDGDTSEFSACVRVAVLPPLTVELVGADLILAWTNTPPGLVLKQTSSLTPPINWSAVTAQPLLIDGLARVILQPSPGCRFYTLQIE